MPIESRVVELRVINSINIFSDQKDGIIKILSSISRYVNNNLHSIKFT